MTGVLHHLVWMAAIAEGLAFVVTGAYLGLRQKPSSATVATCETPACRGTASVARTAFFTDPFYRRSWWNHTEKPQEKQCVYYLAPDHKTVKLIAGDLKQPNGIIGTPDGKTLYVADIGDNKTWVYRINTDGTLSEKKLFCELGSDGMTIDKKGNIYITGKGVTVFDKTGKRLGNISVSENWTANVCFGGSDRKELFITASKGLYRIRTRVRGAY